MLTTQLILLHKTFKNNTAQFAMVSSGYYLLLASYIPSSRIEHSMPFYFFHMSIMHIQSFIRAFKKPFIYSTVSHFFQWCPTITQSNMKVLLLSEFS